MCPNDPSENCGGPSAIYTYSFSCGSSLSTYKCTNNACVRDPSGQYFNDYCDNQCASPGPSGSKKKKGVSGGDVVLIIFFCGLVMPYLVFGALYMRVRHSATGVDLIPNRGFWVEIPGLIKDGFSFTLSGFKPTNSYTRV